MDLPIIHILLMKTEKRNNISDMYIYIYKIIYIYIYTRTEQFQIDIQLLLTNDITK